MSRTSAPNCPRCGYDQSGHLDSPGAAPEGRGLCPECGLEFEWADVLDPDRWRLAGLAEHAKRPPQFVVWSVRTWWWAVLPWRFWRRVKLHHRVRPGMLLAWLGAAVLLPHVLAAGLDMLWVRLYAPWGGPGPGWGTLDPLVRPIAALGGRWGGLPRVEWVFLDWPTVSLWVVAVALLWPIVLGLMPISLSRASVRWGHVGRATAYSAAVPALYFWIQAARMALVFGTSTFVRRGSGTDPFLYDLYRYAEAVEAWHIRLTIAWLAVWWLLVLTLGWRLRHGWIAWLAMIVLVAAICAALFGAEVTVFGRVYRW